jgi:Uma2 family endonuclease
MSTQVLMTAAEFFRSGRETDGFELVCGELRPMPPPEDRHGEVAANVVFVLKTYVRSLGHGTVVCNDAGILTRRDPDSVRGVDAALFLRPNWQDQPAPEGYTGEPPDLVVEIRSPSEDWPDVLDKVGEYLRMRARLVWVVDPRRQRVTTFSRKEEPTALAPENELDGGDILPGFRCRVAELFA